MENGQIENILLLAILIWIYCRLVIFVNGAIAFPPLRSHHQTTPKHPPMTSTRKHSPQQETGLYSLTGALILMLCSRVLPRPPLTLLDPNQTVVTCTNVVKTPGHGDGIRICWVCQWLCVLLLWHRTASCKNHCFYRRINCYKSTKTAWTRSLVSMKTSLDGWSPQAKRVTPLKW